MANRNYFTYILTRSLCDTLFCRIPFRVFSWEWLGLTWEVLGLAWEKHLLHDIFTILL